MDSENRLKAIPEHTAEDSDNEEMSAIDRYDTNDLEDPFAII